MLTLLRQSVGTWVAKVFILLLVASFGVWGVSGAILGGASGSVIQVGKTSVSARDYVLAYERSRSSFSRQLGRLLTREEMRTFGIDNNVLSQLMSGAILDESARNMGLGLSDKNLASIIGEDKTFQDASGNFDRRILVQQLRQLGMNETDYVSNRQAVAVRRQLIESISANTAAPQVFVSAYDAYRNEKRVFDYVTLTPQLLEKQPSPTADDIKSHYDKNKSDYVAPEFRKIIVVKLEAEDISQPDAITKQQLNEEYETRKQEFVAKEIRAIQQLTLSDNEQGKSILKRIADGETFDTILAELGKSDKDIAIGEFTIDDLPDANVGTAAFALELNKVSDVVNGIFGPVLLRVTDIVPQTVKPLLEVEADLRVRLAKKKASEELFDIHDLLEDERAAGDTLSEAAAKVKLTPRIIEMIDSSGRDQDGNLISDLPQSTKLLSEVFDTAEGVETDPISIGNSGYVWYEVKDVIFERQKKLEEVKEDVSKNWVDIETAAGVEKLAKELQSKIDDGDDFTKALAAILPSTVSEEQQTPKVEKSAQLSREDTSSDLVTAAVRAGFSVGLEKTALSVGSNKGEQVVLKIVEIVNSEGNSVGPEELKQLDETIADDLLNQLIADLRQREEVTIDQNAIVAAQSLVR